MNANSPDPIPLEDLRQALLSLYRLEELGASNLAARLVPHAPNTGRALRRLLLDGIEHLRPSGRLVPSASEFRAHSCLSMRYIDGLTVEEISEELELSARQVYRDLRWAESRLCAVLLDPPAPDESVDADRSPYQAPPPGRSPEQVDLAPLVSQALTVINPLARALGVEVRVESFPAGCMVEGTPGVLGEIVAQSLSAVVQSRPRTLAVRLEVEADEVHLVLPIAGSREVWSPLVRSALQAAEEQGVHHLIDRQDRQNLIRLVFPRCQMRQLLVVEDNPAAYALYQRYLANTGWQPVLVEDPRRAADLAAEHGAQAILLDIMMPDTDGWRVLQALRTDQRTRSTPVIICSVVNDPALGSALGATDYLTKPVTRQALLQALARV